MHGGSQRLKRGALLGKRCGARRAEHFFLAIQFVQRIGPEHDTLRILTMVKAQQVPDLMGSLFCEPVDQVVIVAA
jgi:hypothetical protein